MVQKYDRNQPDQVDLLRAAVVAQAHVEWRNAAGRDWDEKLARIVLGRRPSRDEERARAVALDLANALSAYARLRSRGAKGYRKRQRRRKLSSKYPKLHAERLRKHQELRAQRRTYQKVRAERRRKHGLSKRRRSPAAESILEAIDKHFEAILASTDERDGEQVPIADFLLSFGTPTPDMAPRVRVAAMPIEVWRAFGLKESPTTRLLAIASLLLANFPDLPAEKTRFSVADVIQLEANGIRTSLRNVKSKPERAGLVASRALEDLARYRERLDRRAARPNREPPTPTDD